MQDMQDDEWYPDYDSGLSLSAEFVRIALGILRTYRKPDSVPDVEVTMAFVYNTYFVGISYEQPFPDHLTVKLSSAVSGLQLSAQRIPLSEPVGSLNTADPLALLTFVEGITRTDQLFNVVLRIEAFPNTPPVEEELMRRILMALHPYKHGWAVDTVLPPPSLPETLIAEGPSTKPSVIWMNRMMDNLFDERAARQLANEFYVWMLTGLGLNKYSEDDFHPETEFIHVGDDFVSVILQPRDDEDIDGGIIKVPNWSNPYWATLVHPQPSGMRWERWNQLLLPTRLGLPNG